MSTQSLPSTEIQPTAQDSNLLKQVWQNLTKDSCPYQYNFHLHTRCSDGQLSPKDLMRQASAIGLSGMAITDHHSTLGYEIAQKWLISQSEEGGSQRPFPHLWTGIEITALLGKCEVHILGYAFDIRSSSMQPYQQSERPQGGEARADRVIDALHQAGGLAILAHPFRYKRPAADLLPLAVENEIDGLEAYYAYGNPNPWQPSDQQTEATKAFCDEYGLLATCGTDTHGTSLLRRI